MQPMARAMQAINPRAIESSAPTDVGQLRHYDQNGCWWGSPKLYDRKTQTSAADLLNASARPQCRPGSKTRIFKMD
jgi:hypothetical protein